MRTIYFGLNEEGEKVWFKSKTAIRNCKDASEKVGNTITKFYVAPLFYQIFRFLLPKN